MPASRMCHGVSKSGSPTPSEMASFIFATMSKKSRMPDLGRLTMCLAMKRDWSMKSDQNEIFRANPRLNSALRLADFKNASNGCPLSQRERVRVREKAWLHTRWSNFIPVTSLRRHFEPFRLHGLAAQHKAMLFVRPQHEMRRRGQHALDRRKLFENKCSHAL